jgi:hypothetical protein
MGSSGHGWQRQPPAHSDDKEPPSILRNPEVACVQHGRQRDIVAGQRKAPGKPIGHGTLLARKYTRGHRGHVLQDECGRFQRYDEPRELLDELVARIVWVELPTDGEALARRPPEDDVDPILPVCSSVSSQAVSYGLAQATAVEARSVLFKYLALWKVEAMRSSVRRIALHGANHVEARLLEAESHASNPPEEVHRHRPTTGGRRRATSVAGRWLAIRHAR